MTTPDDDLDLGIDIGIKMVRNTKATRALAELNYRKVRSSISNGSSLLTAVDHRSAAMRRLRDLIADHVSDLGGAEALSSSERQLVRRASMLALQCELMEAKWNADTGEASAKGLEVYQRCTNTLRRTIETLGLKRRQRVVGESDSDIDALIDAARRPGRVGVRA